MGIGLKPSQSLLCNAAPWIAWAFGISSLAKEVSLEWIGEGPKWSKICKYPRPYESKKLDSITLPSNIQAVPIELNLRETKWFLLPIYRPPCQNEYVFHDHIERVIDFYSKSIDNVLIFGDFNMETTRPVMTDFLENHNLCCMIKTSTCLKSVKGRCIDLMLANNKHSFFGSQTFEILRTKF